jgi:hypothetical protein
VTNLADADALAAVLACWQADPDVLALLGGDPDRIGGTDQPPYPRLRATATPAGSNGTVRWLVTTEIRVEAIGDLDGRPGSAALRELLFTALAAAADMPTRHRPGFAVVTDVQSFGTGQAPLPGAQPRWISTLSVTAHPPV